MTPPIRRIVIAIVLSVVCAAQELPGGGGEQTRSVMLFRDLATVGLDVSRVYRIRDAHLDREDLHISFGDGLIGFTHAVDGRITGALFQGEGDVLLIPPDRAERWSLGLFTGAAILEQRFSTAYLRFNDDVFAELQPALRPFVPGPPTPQDEEPDLEPSELDNPAEPPPASPAEFVRKWDTAASHLAYLSALRLLVTFGDAETVAPDHTIQWTQPANDRLLFARVGGTPRGIFDIYYDSRAPEQIAVAQAKRVEDGGYYDVWTSFPARSRRMRVQAATASVQTQAAAEQTTDPLVVPRYTIRVRIASTRQMEADATLDVEAAEPGHRVLIFELSRFLQVREVSANGRKVEFVQNEALEGSSLARRGNDQVAVVLPQPLAPHQPMKLRFVYAGDVLSDAGGGLMYVGARGIWYPNRGFAMSDFDLEFRYPAEWTLIATGKLVSSPAEQTARSRGGEAESAEQVAHYVSERPMPVAGFNLGRYVKAEAKSGNIAIEAYAARGVEKGFPQPKAVFEPPLRDPLTGRQITDGSIIAPSAPAPAEHVHAVAVSAAQAIEFLSRHLGPYPYSSLALTQMPGRSSQGWPGLIYLSSYSYLSGQERRLARLTPLEDFVFGRLMLPHETAHQWFGDLLIWRSYREQWLVEALSNYCVLMMIEEQDPAAFRAMMEQYRRALMAPQKSGRLLYEAGPVTLGVRLNSSVFPDAYEAIAYGRGTWLFHMLRHMLRDSTGEDVFFTVLRRVRERYEGKDITTRDLQRAFEEALPASLRYEGRKSLEWFFDGWVNGADMPALALSEVKITSRGTTLAATGKIVQKHAHEGLVTSVPLYADRGGKPVLLGRVFADGTETSFRFNVPAGTKKILLDPYQTVLTRP